VQPEEKKNNWEFHWDSGNRSRIGLAVGILAIGIQLIASSYLQRDLSFGTLLWPTALLVYGAFGLFPSFSLFRFGCFVFGGYFLLEKWELLPIALGDNIAFPVILVLLGLSLLMDAIKNKKKPSISFSNHGKHNYDYSYGDDFFDLDTSFGSMTQVITLASLRKGNIDASFGNYTVDFTQVKAVAEDCRLDVDSSFGQVTLLVPGQFRVHNTPSTSFGNVEVIGSPEAQPVGTIYLDADISFGKLIIQYV
jgi:predicted membrane protein